MVLDAVSHIQQFADAFLGVYLIAILLFILTSWIRVPYSLRPVQRFLDDICGPYLRQCRRVLPISAGGLDFSPVVGIFGLIALRYLVDALLNRLH